MKIKKIEILLIVAVFLIPNFTNAGCFTRDDIKFRVTKSPNVKCLDVKINKTCLGEIELKITNNCGNVVIYEDGNGKQTKITKSFIDPDIPYGFVNWTREFYLEKDPNDKVLISVENIKVDQIIPSLSDDMEDVLSVVLAIIALIFTLAGVVNIIKTSFRKKRKKINNSQHYEKNISNKT